MAMRAFEEYIKGLDRIERLVNLGPIGRIDERAKYASVFSKTDAAAMRTAGKGNGINSTTWPKSADFCERVDTLLANCYRLAYDDARKKPLSAKTPELEKILIDFIEWSSK